MDKKGHTSETRYKSLGHDQPEPNVMVTDNTSAKGFVNDRSKINNPKRREAHFNWNKERPHTPKINFKCTGCQKMRPTNKYSITMQIIYIHTAPTSKSGLSQDAGLTSHNSAQLFAQLAKDTQEQYKHGEDNI